MRRSQVFLRSSSFLHRCTAVLLSIFCIACRATVFAVTDMTSSGPRTERLKNQTSGEEVWLKSLRGGMDDSYNSAAKDLGDTNAESHKVKEGEAKYFKRNSLLISEDLMAQFLPLSQSHGLDTTSSVDRATMAQLLNLVHSEDASLELTSSLNTANYFIGLFYLYGLADMSQADPMKAMEYFYKSAENGNGDAQCVLGLILYYGIYGVVGQDKKSAMRWFYRASVDSDHPRGHWLLGKVIYEGMYYDDIKLRERDQVEDDSNANDDKTRNLAESARLFKKAADQNIPEALHQLAVMYEYDLVSNERNDVNKKERNNFTLALQNYKRAAELGYVESLYHLGLMFAYGRGVASNFTIAADYFRRAAMNNHAPSLRYLGIFAINGHDQPDGIPNTKLALRWFEKCLQFSLYSDIKDLCLAELSQIKAILQNIRAHEAMTLKKFDKKWR